jgi:ABC-2 type transport system ATP-binding protein
MESNANPVIKTMHLTKRFSNLVAVNDLNLEVYRGDVFGFLGPNGSGKSTTMGLMLGLIAPTGGKVELFGLNVRDRLPQILKRTGAVTESTGFYPYLSGRDNLEYIASITGGISPARIQEVFKLVELAERQNDRFSTYSLGMKQRLALGCALLGDPELIILDEPTNGLDPAGMKEIRELIIELGHQGKTIFLNSHLLHEVQQVCSRVAIIKKGSVIVQGTVKELMKQGDVLEIKTNDTDRAEAALKGIDWISSVDREGDKLLLAMDTRRAAEISALLAHENIFLTEMKPKENTLEDFFLEMTEEENR